MHAREDCNLVVLYWSERPAHFDSCMREDCNPCLPLQIFRTLIYFDSCMCEDCNEQRRQGRSHDYILIHACARIATCLWCQRSTQQAISIHACARIVTRQRVGTAHNGSRILIHACARIAIRLLSAIILANKFRFMHV